MKPLAALAPLIVAAWLGVPALAVAQPPEEPRVQQPQPAPPEAQPAPRTAVPRAEPARPAGETTTQRGPVATPGDAQQPGGARVQRRPPSGGGSPAGGGRDAQAVPRSRPREDRRVTGRAVPRTSAPPQATRPIYVYRYPSSRWYSPYGYGAFGVGYFYYDPWAWSPYGYGYGHAGYYPRWGGPYGYDIGNVRLRVTPKDAEVFVDGYYAGIVDDFDGMFQRLRLDSGAYRIEIRKPGYETLMFDVRVQYGRTITFRGEMVPIP
jgi:hypothetical protein